MDVDVEPPSSGESPENAAKRFVIELEFVQLLADPKYLQFLAKQAYLSQPAFLRYLAYLYATWTAPEYVTHLLYPHCLTYLRCILMDPQFRVAVLSDDFIESLRKQQIEAWEKGVPPTGSPTAASTTSHIG